MDIEIFKEMVESLENGAGCKIFNDTNLDDLEYIVSLMEERNTNISLEELAYCDYIKVKIGNRLVYASALFYGLVYKLLGDE